MADPIIQIKNMNKWFGDFQVLKDINLDVEANKKIVVCGPSGSGKSTLIRCINRLEEHQKGSIVVDGTELSEETKNIEQIRAEVGVIVKLRPLWHVFLFLVLRDGWFKALRFLLHLLEKLLLFVRHPGFRVDLRRFRISFRHASLRVYQIHVVRPLLVKSRRK